MSNVRKNSPRIKASKNEINYAFFSQCILHNAIFHTARKQMYFYNTNFNSFFQLNKNCYMVDLSTSPTLPGWQGTLVLYIGVNFMICLTNEPYCFINFSLLLIVRSQIISTDIVFLIGDFFIFCTFLVRWSSIQRIHLGFQVMQFLVCISTNNEDQRAENLIYQAVLISSSQVEIAWSNRLSKNKWIVSLYLHKQLIILILL